MLRKKKYNSEYEIDRELTGKLAIESNAELQDKVERLEEENRKLRFELGESQTHRWVDVKDLKNKVEHQKSALKSMEQENKKLKETIKDHQLYEEKLEHRIIEFEELLHGE